MADETAHLHAARPAPAGTLMPTSRRTLLRLAIGAAGAAAAGLFAMLGTLGRRAGPPALEPTAPGPLAADQVQTLLAAAAAIIGEPLRAEHYAAFFRWRAEHLPGHRTLYQRFCRTLDRAARRAAGRPFAACSTATRRALVEPALRAGVPPRAGQAPRDRVDDRAWILYHRHIAAEVLALFAATDAWLLLGYSAWPGTPRGLDRYRERPV
jgi:hypothetical protein